MSKTQVISILGDAKALEKFGIRLKALRLRRNLSQEYVAGVVGVSVSTYRKMSRATGCWSFAMWRGRSGVGFGGGVGGVDSRSGARTEAQGPPPPGAQTRVETEEETFH